MSSDQARRNRRQFLSRATAALAAAGAAGFGRPAQAAAQAAGAGRGPVIKRRLGRTGLELPIVSMGVMNANNPGLLKQAYEAGVRLFDTAEGYQQGRNEQMIGEVFAQMGVRDRVILQTKLRFPRGDVKARLLAACDESLQRLRTGQVDLLLLHQPSVEQMNDPEAVAALRQLKQQKKTRFIGVSTHANQAGVLRSAAETGIYDAVTASFNVTNAADGDLLAALKAAAAKGVGVIAMKTQTGGRARNLGPLNHTALLKWALRHEELATAIPGFTNSDQLAESFSVASGLEYTAEEKAWLSDKNAQASLDFCKQCGACRPTCPRGVDIPTLMRAHMYAASYANFERARATFDEVPASAGLAQCGSCAECSARCANAVRIGERVADLRAMYA